MDDEAALKYLRILDKTLLHKSWAEKRIPGQQTPRVKEWLEKKRRDIPTQDHLRSGNDAVTSLRNLVASTPAISVLTNTYSAIIYSLKISVLL